MRPRTGVGEKELDVETGEKEPLLSSRSNTSTSKDGPKMDERQKVRYKNINSEELGMKKSWSGHYDPNQLATFKTFTYRMGTVFQDRHIWMVVGSLATVACVVAGCVVFLLHDPHMLDTSKFDKIVKYLKVFLAFLLGMFMNNSLNRWWQTVNTTTDYFNNVEKLLFLANAFAVVPNRRAEMIRYAIASCICLRTEVCQTWEKDKEKIRACWANTLDELLDGGYLVDEEVDCLMQIRPGDRAVCVWGWVSAVLCVMFEREDMKPMAMNRLTQQCQVAVDMVSQLKTQICIQLPFMYVHMMACMVHLNNLLVAVNCGLGLGGSMAVILHIHGGGHDKDKHPGGTPQDAVGSNVVEASSTFVVYLVTLFFEPLLYQAFLQIGATFCYPFGNEYHSVPLPAMIKDLEKNLLQMCFIVDSRTKGLKELPGESPKAKKKDTRAEEDDDGDE